MAILTRRTFLAAGGGLVALGALGFGGSLVACNRANALAALPLDRLDVALADIRAPGRIGRAWRAREAWRASASALQSDPEIAALAGVDCAETRRAGLRARFRADFKNGAVEVADRWVVSRTECRIAALLSA